MFKQGLPQAEQDESGLFMMGYRVAPDSGDSYSDYKIRSCPVAGANRMASLVQAYQRHKAGLLPISQSYPTPSCALIEAIEILHYNAEESQYRTNQQMMREAQNVKSSRN